MTAEVEVRARPKPPPRKRKRRRPIRRFLDVTHRWLALILGLFLVIECTAGAVLLYHAELFRAGHGEFYTHTAAEQEVTADQALHIVRQAHPDFDAAWVSHDGGILAVGSGDYSSAWAVDPGTGRINGFADLNGGYLGWLVNMHDCAFTCPGAPWTVAWLSAHVPTMGITWLNEITWGSVILGVLGLLLVFLAVSGAILWWPTVKRIAHGFRVRFAKGRYARDLDLHNVIGIIAVPFLLMWGITGAAFEFPVVSKVWLAATGGSTSIDDESQFTFTPRTTAADAATLSVDDAAEVALQHAPGRVGYLSIPTEAANYYSVAVAGAYAPYGQRAFYSGDVMVYVNPHDGSDIKVVDASHGRPLANTFHDKVFEPAHFGWLVNPWWRIVWFALGMTPLALMITGLSTWFYKRGVAKRRRAAKASAIRR